MKLIDRPFFLVGSERSGTTLLRLMLDHHPRIAFNHETHYIVTQISDEGRHPEMERYREWLINDRSFQHSRFSINEQLDYVGLVNDFLNQKRVRDHKEFVGATVHHQYRMLHTIWPRAKYIYLYRDGRDVATSIVRMGWAGNTYAAADWWLRAEKEWDEVRSTTASDDWLEVRYEELVLDTTHQLERICTFLGVEFSERMLDYTKDSTYSAPDISMLYQWKTGLKKIDVQRLEDKLGDRLLKRGYQLSNFPRISVSRFMRKYLNFQSRAGRFMFRIGRYGVLLTFQETLSRRLSLNNLHKETIKKINRIADTKLK